MDCDHTLGSRGSHVIPQSQWAEELQRFAAGIYFFTTTRLAVEHPGHISSHMFCTSCGCKLDETTARNAVGDAVILGLDAADGKLVPVPSYLQHTRESYNAWLRREDMKGKTSCPA
jgi:hypothetical protein